MDLDEYQWALKHPDSLIKTKTFSSTSTERTAAEKFVRAPTSEVLSVLMILVFPTFVIWHLI